VETINASEFKAKCLSILDRVHDTGERVLILKRGKPVAELIPASNAEARYPQQALAGSVTLTGDVIEPVLPEADWESLR